MRKQWITCRMWEILWNKGTGGKFQIKYQLSRVQLFATPWTPALQASLSITSSRSLLKLTSIELVLPSNHLVLPSCPRSFPASGSFQMSQFFSSGAQNIGVSASASVLSINIQDWFPLGWTGWISLQSKGLSRVFSIIGVSASASVLSVNTQDWSPLGWTGWISLRSKGLSRIFSNTTVQKHQFSVLSFLYSPTLTSIHDYWKNRSLD